ncbi:ATPase [Amycolatopsis sp. K13G38]|uniref:ATPase n=1 Tax=Amycolatopsis acididurans TaxID=2724524 RepID=A0ABX1JFX5_9PSEU|nr:LuxR C-terminal-related transcriptional regulator [Amycolatopsis acididurans]NKQ58692.1 ATPase [Amycolatopsis acididurans]
MPEPPRPSGSLPAELTSFVGRRRELAETKRLLTQSRLVTLTGMGGVGKTRLALRAGAGMRRAFPDGVWFVPLAELREPAMLSAAIATALGLTDSATANVAGLAEYLDDKRLLLILDNCEHVLHACAVLTAKLLSAAHGVRILATSRQILRADGEQILTVPPLSVPEGDGGESPGHSESVTLFADRAAAVQPGFQVDARNREDVVRLCQRLDGIPLAIELAAVRLRVLSLEQVLHRLDNRFRLLTTGSRTVLPRQRTLEATVEWSYELCTPQEQAVWRAVSVLPGGFDLDAAEIVCTVDGVEPGDVLDLIAALVDKSVLTRRDGTFGRTAWYRMLETVREYGQLKLAESGREPEVRARHVEYCLRLARQYRAESFGPAQLDWIRRLRREHAILRAALDHCLHDATKVRHATEIAASLWDFWYAAGFLVEGHHWIRQALALDTEPTPARARALGACAFMSAQFGEPDAAWGSLNELAVLAERFDDDLLRAGHAQVSGLVRFYSGDALGGREAMERALRGYRAAGDEFQVFNTLVLLSSVTFFLADPDGARYAEEALSLAVRCGADWSKTYALWAVAVHAWRAGAPQRATALLREAIAMRLSDRTQLAFAIGALAWCAQAMGQHERAAGLLGAAQAVWLLSGARVAESRPYQTLNEQCAERSRAALGAQAYQAAFDAAASFGPDEAISFALAEKAGKPRTVERRSSPGGLTRREREIAELVAEGLSNRAIATRLVIAQRTAETHVENILAKLGFTSRAQIAAWLAEHRGNAV